MYSLIIRPTAQVDLQGIIDYYDSTNPKLGDVFLKEMEQAVHHIQ